jgi:thymidine kinase
VIRMAPERGGWLEVVCGPMFSGKSEELIRRLRRAEIAGQKVLIVKPRIDDRYDVSHVVSHAGARIRAVAVDSSAEILGLADGYETVGIDELHFFDPGLAGVVQTLVDRGVRVIGAGLAQDFRGLPFAPLPELLCIAEFVDKLQAVCHRCGGPATLTQRLIGGAPAPFSGKTIVVGAAESPRPSRDEAPRLGRRLRRRRDKAAYEARCRACYEPGKEAALPLSA